MRTVTLITTVGAVAFASAIGGASLFTHYQTRGTIPGYELGKALTSKARETFGSVQARLTQATSSLSDPGGVSANAAVVEDVTSYTCPMHPHYISSDFGTCPICGMDLVPASGGSAAAKGDGSIVVSSEMIQTMGIRTVPAQLMSLGKTLRAFGIVENNERLISVSVSRLEGWLENLSVRAVGDEVAEGKLLYEIYSPDLIAAQKDYLSALNIGSQTRINSVLQRLISVGMQTTAIERLTQTRKIIERVPVYTEAAGTVTELRVRDGDYVKPGSPILALQSYAAVWVMASIPETDLAQLTEGLEVLIDFPSAPQASTKGKIDYIYPTIDAQTRTGKLRIELDNVAGYLRPGAYADIAMQLGSAQLLAVPSEAILRDSRGAHLISALGEGRFAARAVELGVSADGWTHVLAGISEGELIVASGQFMLDSEVNLREGFAKLQAPPLIQAGPDTPFADLPIDASTLAEIDHITDMAIYFHEALIDRYRIDSFYVDPAIERSEQLRDRFADTKLIPVLIGAESALRAAQDANKGDPLANELARLVSALQPWLLEGAPVHYKNAGVVLYQEVDTGRLWVQLGDEPQNPYGNGAAQIVDWPDPMSSEAKTDDTSERLDVSSSAQ